MLMANLMRYDPFREMLSLRGTANRMFERSFVFPTWGITNTTLAPVDVIETEQGYQVKVLLPGIKPEDIELTARQNSLTIKGQHASTKEEKNENGVLTITVPYSEAAKPKKISIKKEEPKELSEAAAR